MGKTFKYVADDSLEAHRHHDLRCPLCGSADNVYPFYASPEGSAVTEAYTRCIRSLPLDAIWPWRSEQKAGEHLRATFPRLPAEELARGRVGEYFARHQLHHVLQFVGDVGASKTIVEVKDGRLQKMGKEEQP